VTFVYLEKRQLKCCVSVLCKYHRIIAFVCLVVHILTTTVALCVVMISISCAVCILFEGASSEGA